MRHNFWKKKASSLRVIKKKKVQFFESSFKNINFKSLRQVPFFESYEKSILWEIFPKKSLNHLKTWITCKKMFNSLSRIEKKKEGSILWLWVVYIWQKFNSLNHIRKEVQFFESHLKKGSILWDTFRKKRFNSLSHFEKKGPFFESDLEKGSILWVRFRKKFTSLSHVQKKKKAHFFESYSNEGSSLWVIFKKRERFNSFESW